MSTYKFRFSIFTATFNRARLLASLYDDIRNQKFNSEDFEWVIVSDGSTDDTALVVNRFIDEGKVNIKFIDLQVNSGKHMAWKVATKAFEGRYVVTADDDDPISHDMLSTFDKYWRELEMSPDYERFWEIRARSQYEDGTLVGAPLPSPYFDSDYIEVTYKMKKGAEMVGCRKVEILKTLAAVPDQIHFGDKCSNYPEGYRWVHAARIFKTRFVPDITRTYIVGHESLCINVKGCKRSVKRNYNSLVSALYAINTMSDILLKYTPIMLFTTILRLAYSSIRVKEKVIHLVESPIYRTLLFFAYLPAFVLYALKNK